MKRIWRVTATVQDYVYAETEDEAIRIATDIPQRDLCMNSNNWDATPAVDRTGFVIDMDLMADKSLAYGDEDERPLCELVQDDIDHAKSALVRAEEEKRQRKLFEGARTD